MISLTTYPAQRACKAEACEMDRDLLTSTYVPWVGRLLKLFFVLLSIFALLIVWTFFVPVLIPMPPFRSALVSALERSNATLRATQRDNATAEAGVLAHFLPNGLTIKEAEIVLRKEWFHCGPFQDVGASEATRWGEKYRHYMICERYTYYHPLYMGGWRIELFASPGNVIEGVRAIRWYDGL
jgi:hypothetical protein